MLDVRLLSAFKADNKRTSSGQQADNNQSWYLEKAMMKLCIQYNKTVASALEKYLCLKKSQGMDNNIKKKIDEIVNEISAINDLNIKHAVLTYMEQQAGFMLWQMEDEKHIDNDSHNV